MPSQTHEEQSRKEHANSTRITILFYPKTFSMKEQNDNEKREWKLVYIENEDGKEGRKIHIQSKFLYNLQLRRFGIHKNRS